MHATLHELQALDHASWAGEQCRLCLQCSAKSNTERCPLGVGLCCAVIGCSILEQQPMTLYRWLAKHSP